MFQIQEKISGAINQITTSTSNWVKAGALTGATFFSGASLNAQEAKVDYLNERQAQSVENDKDLRALFELALKHNITKPEELRGMLAAFPQLRPQVGQARDAIFELYCIAEECKAADFHREPATEVMTKGELVTSTFMWGAATVTSAICGTALGWVLRKR